MAGPSAQGIPGPEDSTIVMPFPPRLIRTLLASAGLVATAAVLFELPGHADAQTPAPVDHKGVLTQYCQGCHNDRAKTGGMTVQPLDAANLAANDETWEKILRKVSLGEMPPSGARRPPPQTLTEFTHWLATSLDQNAAQHPDPGRSTLRRLNRAEYANAVRDLLDLKFDFTKDLPVDDSGLGFDNIADVLTVSPTLMDQYVRVAGKVARAATGLESRRAATTEFPLKQDPLVNTRASDGLPLDSRGGGVVEFHAPYNGDYVIAVDLNQGAGEQVKKVPENHIEVKVALKAGLHRIGASFPRIMTLQESVLPLTPAAMRGPKPEGAVPKTRLDIQLDGAPIKRVPVDAYAPGILDTGLPSDQVVYRRDVSKISVVGPLTVKSSGDTPSRRHIFSCRPSASLSEAACARAILTRIAHQAYRRPLTEADTTPLMKMYAEGRKDGDFEHGIEAGLELVLVSPSFLFMHENDPAGAAPGSVHRLSDVELATRLSFFLWSSIPDAQLLSLAEKGQLAKPDVLKRQVARMLADPKASALTDNFAGQWLYLRRLEVQRPDKTIFPDFDERLRDAMLTETDMFFDSVVRQNRSVLDFINADYTYVNQRLAEHYGIPGVRGATFRRVKLDPALHRGGLLGQGSILTVTSYENRTSVVLRGKWILENLLAAAPPPPPPNVPPLDAVPGGAKLTLREQMEIHRKNPVCASCHSKMDPLGFSLENFDAVGAWRTTTTGKTIDASAVLPDGTKFDGPAGLEQVLLSRKDQFVEAFTERLMIYALGRGVEAPNLPAIRAIRAASAKDNYRIGDIILGIVQSVPFTMRRTPNHDDPA
jgi:mono/diheme cytochrome c family protein